MSAIPFMDIIPEWQVESLFVAAQHHTESHNWSMLAPASATLPKRVSADWLRLSCCNQNNNKSLHLLPRFGIQVTNIALTDFTHIIDWLAAADITIAGMAVVLWLGQQQHGFFHVAEPTVGVFTDCLGETAGVVHMSMARVVRRQAKIDALF